MRTRLVLFIWWLLFALTALGVDRNSPTASRTDVLATIALCSPGDRVIVPADASESWSGGDITISGISLVGPGKGAGSPTVITAGRVVLTKHATHTTKLEGFRFTGNSHHFAVGGNLTAKPFIVKDCYFFNAGATMASMTTNGGLVKDCEFDTSTPHSADVFAINLGGTGTDGQTSWEADQTMGTADTNGETNTYFEDCTWDGFLEVSMDVDNGARVVVRHCTFTDSSIVVHGGGSGSSGNDTSSYGGKHLEVYNCTFVRVSNAVAINKWVWWRGGGGVFANNTVAEASSPDGSSFPNKPELRFTVGCPGAYPLSYQVGQTILPAENGPVKPLAVFGNTGAGAGSGNFITIGENPNNSCGTPSNYIQASRDYVTTNSWSWTAYEYPHPLDSESSSGASATTINAGTLITP